MWLSLIVRSAARGCCVTVANHVLALVTGVRNTVFIQKRELFLVFCWSDGAGIRLQMLYITYQVPGMPYIARLVTHYQPPSVTMSKQCSFFWENWEV